MEYRGIENVTILGIGGKGAFYIAKYLLLLGKKVYGYDLRSSERTSELESLGATITYSNPNSGERFSTDAYIYSNDLPRKLQASIAKDNEGIHSLEVGQLYHQMVEDYESGILSSLESKAFEDSNIAPLYKIDQSKMKYIAVTGTDGKTTTCTMIYHILKGAGFKPAMVTTVAAKIGENDIDTGFHTTTPSSQEIFELIKKAEKEDCTHIVLETTSHGLSQGRLMGLKFDAVAYTNITEEHLDYHKSWGNLAQAKSLLISKHSKENSVVILNCDDERAFNLLSKLHNYKSYGIENDADLMASNILEDTSGLSFVVNGENINLPILGRYNVSNFLAASLLLMSLEDIKIESIAKYIGDFKTIKGRMEVIQKDPYFVIVDYAHTPNALENALQSARKLTRGRIIHVFGSAGHRDFYKRPIMGRVSNENADITILTAEDPRLESLKEINDQIESGYKEGGNKDGEIYRFDDDQSNVKVRIDAIKKALELAKNGDLVIITGKAHENSLCFGQTEYDWNDIEQVKKLLTS